LAGFVDELTRRFATSTQDVFARVKVMTLYKAKGLEFDTVIIPGLAETRSGDEQRPAALARSARAAS
jgi:ATP-dependent exoDNAse (exonuclease V) beta subunit